MTEILHRIYIRTVPDKLYEALATEDGLKSWWTPQTRAESTVGSVATFRFGDESMGPDMTILDLIPGQLVRWECVGGIEDWIGTTFEFSIRPHKEGSLLLFAQRGWEEQSEFYMHCNCKWAFFLGVSLKQYLEEGQGMPYPQDPDF